MQGIIRNGSCARASQSRRSGVALLLIRIGNFMLGFCEIETLRAMPTLQFKGIHEICPILYFSWFSKFTQYEFIIRRKIFVDTNLPSCYNRSRSNPKSTHFLTSKGEVTCVSSISYRFWIYRLLIVYNIANP